MALWLSGRRCTFRSDSPGFKSNSCIFFLSKGKLNAGLPSAHWIARIFAFFDKLWCVNFMNYYLIINEIFTSIKLWQVKQENLTRFFLELKKLQVLPCLDFINCTYLVLDSGTRSHHHTTTNGVNGVRHKSSSDGNSPTQQEWKGNWRRVSQKNRFQRVIKTKVHATVDENTDARDNETTVKTLDTVGLDGLDIDIDQAVELTFTTLTFGIIGQSGKKMNI